jgi:predicted nucleic acid-binding protein
MSDRILPDTNVLAEVWNPRGSVWVRAAFASVADHALMSVIVLGEIFRGVQQLPDSRRRDKLAEYYLSLVRNHSDAILPVTLAVAEAWGAMTASARVRGRVLPASDGLIAATAMVHDLTLWTRNTDDFAGTGVRLVNPWDD